jgi:competence protein ComEC
MRLIVHFLNVGHGDCTFIELPSGRLMMIDINNSKSLPEDDVAALAAARGLSSFEFNRSGSYAGLRSWKDYYESLLVDPHDYYRANFPGQAIFRYVQTHPDMDHMSGLYRFFWQERVPLLNFWDVGHGKTCDEKDFESSPYNYADWVAYSLLRLGSGPDDTEHHVITNYRGAQGLYWSDDNIRVLSPTPQLVADCDRQDCYNDCSYVLKISYGGRGLILPGDAEAPAWDSMLEDLSGAELACDLLKASHHGRKSGFHQKAVEMMDPSIVICSVGKKPDTDASADYAKIASSVLSTRSNGTIKVTMWQDGEVWVENHQGKTVASLSPLAA